MATVVRLLFRKSSAPGTSVLLLPVPACGLCSRRGRPSLCPHPTMLLPLLLPWLLPPPLDAIEVTRPRGVSLSNHHFYEASKPFTCLDGSSTIDFNWVNDDYCDCPDGSDEPGTSACPNGHFHCTNAGYRPQNIPSAHVNDGVCDCCDATDEYNSGAACENTCKELGRKEREELQRLAEVAREGFRVKQQLIQEAEMGRKEKQSRLLELQESRRGQEELLATLRAAKEAAEGPEREAKETQQRLWDEQRAAEAAQLEAERAEEAFREMDRDGDGRLTVAELQAHPQLDTDGDGGVTEEEAQALLGGSMEVDAAAFRERVWGGIKERYRTQGQAEPPPPSEPLLEETPPPEEEEEEEEDEAEEEDEDEDGGEGAEEELKVPPPQHHEEKKAEEPPPQQPPFDAATQALIDAAQKAREDFEEAERSLKEMEESIRALEQEIAFDFGPQGEFSYLYNQCYEMGTNEYIYRLCPFKRVSQKPKHGGAETNLGTWGSWAGPDTDRFSAMKYEHGTGCWQGPNRSTTVKLSCGTETAVTATTEPSRCEYLMELVTPAACHPPPPHEDHDEL